MPGTGGRQSVNADAAIGGRDAPFGFDAAFLEKTLESGIERAFFDLKQVVGRALDVLDEGVTVERLAFERAENHHLECAREKVARLAIAHAGSFAIPLAKVIRSRPRAK